MDPESDLLEALAQVDVAGMVGLRGFRFPPVCARVVVVGVDATVDAGGGAPGSSHPRWATTCPPTFVLSVAAMVGSATVPFSAAMMGRFDNACRFWRNCCCRMRNRWWQRPS